MKISRYTSGFTLVELLIVLTIFSTLALLSYRGLTAILDAQIHAERETEKWQNISAFFSRIEQDLNLIAPQPLRTPSGISSAMHGSTGPSSAVLEFNRFSSTDGLDAPNRIAYVLTDKSEIELLLWPSLVTSSITPNRYPVLQDVKTLELKFLGPGSMWGYAWPGASSPSTLPKAIMVRIVLVSGEDIVRVFAL